MKILYLITRAERGGGQIHLLDLVRGFAGKIDTAVGVGEEGYLVDECRALGIPVHVISSMVQPIHPIKDLRALFETMGVIRAVRPDLVHVHTSKAAFLGRLAAALMGVPVVFTAHTWSFAEGIRSNQRYVSLPLERLAARGRQRIINVSDANRRLAIDNKVGRSEQHTTIWNGVAETPWKANPAEIPPRIIMVARFAPQKNQSLLLRALSLIKNQDYRLDLVGDGPLRLEVENEAKSLGISDRVRFLGDRSDVPELLAAAQLFVLSTNWEGLPYSIIEAMRAKLPVICTDVGGIRESVVDGTTGYLVERGNLGQLQDKLTILLSDATLRVRMGAAGRDYYEQHFTIEAMLEKTHSVYRELLSDSPERKK